MSITHSIISTSESTIALIVEPLTRDTLWGTSHFVLCREGGSLGSYFLSLHFSHLNFHISHRITVVAVATSHFVLYRDVVLFSGVIFFIECVSQGILGLLGVCPLSECPRIQCVCNETERPL